jgi:hypothetical protein
VGLQRIPLNDFRGGVNLRSGPFDLERNEAQDALNMSLTFRGALFQRAGKTRFDNGSMPATKRAEYMRPWYTDSGLTWLLASVDGTIYSVSAAGAFTSRFAGTAGSVWCFEQATDSVGADRLWAMNGVDAAKKWDGVAAGTSAWGGTPPAGSMIRLWKNRMIVSGVAATPQRVFYSDIANPESFPAASWIDVKTTDDDLDPVTWLEVVGDSLLIFKRRSVWEVVDNAFGSVRRLGAIGCESRFQSVESGGRAYFFTRNGVYSVSPSQEPTEETANIQPWFPENLSFTSLAKARMAATRDDRILLAVPTGASTVNDKLVEIHSWLRPQTPANTLGPPACMFHDLPVASMCIFRPAFEDKLIGADSKATKLHYLFDGTNDDGTAISSFWFSSWQKFISEEPIERVRRLNVMLAGSCVAELYEDFSTAPEFTHVVTNTTDADPLWDGGVWDGGVWNPENPVNLKRTRPESRGRYHAVKLKNSILNNSFTVYAIEFAIRGGKEH